MVGCVCDDNMAECTSVCLPQVNTNSLHFFCFSFLFSLSLLSFLPTLLALVISLCVCVCVASNLEP